MSIAESDCPELTGDVGTFQELVRLWQERDERFEDIEYLGRRGGEAWLLGSLCTHESQGVRPASLAERVARFGSNRQARKPAPSSRG